MARLIWSVLCSQSIVNQETNNISLLEALEAIRFSYQPENEDLGAPEIIPFPGPSKLVSYWCRSTPGEPERGEMRLVLVTPDDNKLASPDLIIEVNLEDTERYRVTMGINQLPNAGSGRYEFEIQFRESQDEEWVKATSVPLDVEVHREPAKNET